MCLRETVKSWLSLGLSPKTCDVGIAQGDFLLLALVK